MDFADDAAAILVSFMPGEQHGNAISDVMWGAVNPSARLPITMPNVENEVGFTESDYPGIDLVATYTEGLEVGYRWYDANDVTPKFEFGFGLSYTTFKYTDLAIDAGSKT